jgi:hypothetical protein
MSNSKEMREKALAEASNAETQTYKKLGQEDLSQEDWNLAANELGEAMIEAEDAFEEYNENIKVSPHQNRELANRLLNVKTKE